MAHGIDGCRSGGTEVDYTVSGSIAPKPDVALLLLLKMGWMLCSACVLSPEMALTYGGLRRWKGQEVAYCVVGVVLLCGDDACVAKLEER